MKKVDLTGGSPTTITTAGNARGGSWRPTARLFLHRISSRQFFVYGPMEKNPLNQSHSSIQQGMKDRIGGHFFFRMASTFFTWQERPAKRAKPKAMDLSRVSRWFDKNISCSDVL